MRTMTRTSTMTRSEFLRLCAGLGAASVLASCKSDDGSDPDASPPTDATDGPVDAPAGTIDGATDAPPTGCAKTNVQIATNHGHGLIVPPADVAAGVEKTYDITGNSTHPHDILVTAAMFTMLQQNQPVVVTSSEGFTHVHKVTITCS